MLFSKRKHEAEISAEDTVRNAPARDDFIPYYAHYNPHTLITKNGELMQTIKIASNRQGLNYEGTGKDCAREIIRKAIRQCIPNDRYALWIHTIRKRTPIEFKGHYDIPFAVYVHERWQSTHQWRYKYYNEVYVTIMHDGQSAELVNPKRLKNTLLMGANREYRNRYIDAMYNDLDKVTGDLLRNIRTHYNAELLGLTERIPAETLPGVHEPVFYSEPMKFLGTLLNLNAEPYLLPDADISKAINNHAITFGYNAFETRSETGKRRFGALLTLKRYQEAPPDTIDRILQTSTEMIVSQPVYFIPYKKAIKQYRPQKEWFDISGDAYSKKTTGIDQLLRGHEKRPIDFTEQQVSITVIVDEYKHLESEVLKTQKIFGSLGMTTVREDIFLEECFWAQLPGNFEFIRRQNILDTGKVAGFSRLNRFPSGSGANNHWQEALTVLPTQVGSPYFFNFHVQDNGHTLSLDLNSLSDSQASVSLNFLITASLKYDGRLYIFDRKHSSYLMFDKLESPYHRLSPERPLQLNPFTLEHNPRNVGFLVAWCCTLAEPHLGIEQHHKETLRAAIDTLYAGVSDERHVDGLLKHVSAADPLLSDALSRAISEITCCRFGVTEEFDVQARATAFAMDSLLAKNAQGSTAVFAYLMHRIISALDGKPTLIVLHEATELLENPFFAPRLESLMEMLKQNNAMILASVTSPQGRMGVSLQALLAGCATRLYFPDEVSSDYDMPTLGISADDARMLRHMRREDGHLLLKQKNEAISLQVNLDNMADVRAIFANDIKTLITAGGKFAALPKEKA